MPNTDLDTGAIPTRAELEDARLIPLRHPWRWVSAAGIGVVVVLVISTLFTNPRFAWSVVWQYLLSEPIIDGVALTLRLTLIATLLALFGGATLALMRVSENPVLRWTSGAYIWFFRSVPLLVQLIFFYNISALYPDLSLGIPFGPDLLDGNVNELITPLVAAVLAFSLNEAAYTAETVRSGLLSVGKGQVEAGRSMGFNRGQIVRLIILPQALRVFIPPFVNQVVNLLKMTSLVSVIALADILYSAQIIYSKTFETIPLLIVVSIWYLVLVTVLSWGQGVVESRLSTN